MRAINQFASAILLIAIAVSGALIVYKVLGHHILRGIVAPEEVEISVVDIERIKTGPIYSDGARYDADYLYVVKLAIYNACDDPVYIGNGGVGIISSIDTCKNYNISLIKASIPEEVPPHTITYASLLIAVKTADNTPPDEAENLACPILFLEFQLPGIGHIGQVVLDPFKTPEEVKIG